MGQQKEKKKGSYLLLTFKDLGTKTQGKKK